jgi:hypothetical protein
MTDLLLRTFDWWFWPLALVAIGGNFLGPSK